jgi:RNA polymerase sigma-70 factor, ECF subfamily
LNGASVNRTNENRLIQAAQRGSLEAFHQLVHDFDSPMLQLALRITGAEPAARSIYCETMLTLYADLAAFQLECALCLRAYRIIANLCLDYLSKQRARAAAGWSGGKISSALTALSPQERIVFELRHYQGLDLKTVSNVLDTSEEVARNVLLRARRKLCAAQVGM